MATSLVFEDNNDNEMRCYVNTEDLIFISVGQKGDDSGYYSGFITLNKHDVQELIRQLQEAEPFLAEEHPTIKDAVR